MIARRSTLRRIAPLLTALLVGGLAAAAPSGEARAGDAKVVVIDVRRAILDTEEGLRVSATLKKLFESRQAELEGLQRQYQTKKEDLDKQAAAGKLPKEQLQKAGDELARQGGELQSKIYDYQREMQRKESELTLPILQNVLAAVRRLAANEGYDVVVQKDAAPYYRTDLEITDKVIQMVNSGQGAALPKPAAPAGKDAPKPATPPPAAPPKDQPAPKKK